eukprot:TRINITY_DN4040_c0_g1_i4.p1 TRINITY_DN4040_c0_g1~~TRINITY_DN4040_c0_g1_i4.p1  ORF type:complete len:220 (-),score=36.30 TRINITY_DN4040_c0_g1_i4:207-866(-)
MNPSAFCWRNGHAAANCNNAQMPIFFIAPTTPNRLSNNTNNPGVVGAMKKIGICALLQFAAAWPFLQQNALGFISRAFDLRRKFERRWSINFNFMPDSFFTESVYGLSLLGVHVILVFGVMYKWGCFDSEKSVKAYQEKVDDEMLKRKEETSEPEQPEVELNPGYTTLLLFTSNFVGVICARSLHYQFFTWYFHTLPFLLWHTRVSGMGEWRGREREQG